MGLFGLLQGSKKTKTQKLQKTTLTMERKIKSTLGIRALESMPAQAAQAFMLSSDPNASNQDFVRVIEADEVLSAKILRIANSIYFRRSDEARDIETAVAAIGLNELRCILSAAMLKSLLKGKHIAREQLWANAVGCALTARLLCSYCKYDKGEAFLCGLLHDVGKLVMLRKSSSQYEKVLNAVRDGGIDFQEAELAVFDLSHTEVGTWVAEQWQFPSNVSKVICFHHEPIVAKDPLMMSEFIQIADTLAHAAGLGHPPAYSGLRAAASDALPKRISKLGIDSSNDIEQLIERVRSAFDSEYALYQIENIT